MGTKDTHITLISKQVRETKGRLSERFTDSAPEAVRSLRLAISNIDHVVVGADGEKFRQLNDAMDELVIVANGLDASSISSRIADEILTLALAHLANANQ